MDQFEVTVTGGVLCGVVEGSGPPCLLLHGGPGASHLLSSGLRHELAGAMTVHDYQQRGVEPSLAPGPYDVETHVADAVRALDALGLESATIVGHSWGALLGLFLLAAHPERCNALVQVGGVGGVDRTGWDQTDENLSKRMPPAVAAHVEALDTALQAGTAAPGADEEMLALCWPYYFADPGAATPYEPAPISGEVYGETYRSAIEHLDRGTIREALPGVTIPVLFLHGSQDPIPVSAARATAERIADSRFVELEQCGHLPWLERRGAVRDAVQEFLAQAGVATPS